MNRAGRYVERLDVPQAAHCFGGVQVEAPGEHRQTSQQQLLAAMQQRIGPLDSRLQGLLPLRGGTAALGEQPEPLIQAVGKADQRQRAQSGGGQLDGQRQPVQRRQIDITWAGTRVGAKCPTR